MKYGGCGRSELAKVVTSLESSLSLEGDKLSPQTTEVTKTVCGSDMVIDDFISQTPDPLNLTSYTTDPTDPTDPTSLTDPIDPTTIPDNFEDPSTDLQGAS